MARCIRRSIRLCLLGLAAIEAGALVQAQSPLPRQVAAPPSDILSGVVRLPDPASAPFVSRAAVMPLRFRREGGVGWSAEVALPVEKAGDLAIALLSPDAGTWRLLARAPQASQTSPNSSADLRPISDVFAVDRRIGLVGDEMPGFVVDRYDLRGAPSGAWTLRVEADDARGAHPPAEGWLFATTGGNLRIEAYATTLELVSGEVIGIAAQVRRSSAPDPLHTGSLRDLSARVLVESAAGTEELAMADDGLHEDGAAGDGLFGAILASSLRGEVRARVEIAGATEAGQPFLRSVPLRFPVLERRLFLEGSARASAIDEGHVGIAIGALPLAPPSRLHVSAEVWGRDGSGRSVPVCWLSRMLVPEERAGVLSLPLVLDARWLDLAGAREPLELREVRAQDPDTEVVFDRIARMPLEVDSLPRSARRSGGGILPEMLADMLPEMQTGGTSFASASSTPAGSHVGHGIAGFVPALMLVHGYCSSGTIWPAADFTQPKLQFLDPSQNRTHDAFAQQIAAQAQAAGLTSFGIVAHSQGGCAALHLLTYYQSGLDAAQGGRRIQSVASPYQGTPLAAYGGIACGVNNDMTPSGSATWLAGIPTWARAEVAYWTTSDAGTACNAFTDLILADPEDGTVEMFRGQLPGGSSMGHVTGWCHTTGMSYPANYTDHSRNQAMNVAAAR